MICGFKKLIVGFKIVFLSNNLIFFLPFAKLRLRVRFQIGDVAG
jgi:hypothetical protein